MRDRKPLGGSREDNLNQSSLSPANHSRSFISGGGAMANQDKSGFTKNLDTSYEGNFGTVNLQERKL